MFLKNKQSNSASSPRQQTEIPRHASVPEHKSLTCVPCLFQVRFKNTGQTSIFFLCAFPTFPPDFARAQFIATLQRCLKTAARDVFSCAVHEILKIWVIFLNPDYSRQPRVKNN